MALGRVASAAGIICGCGLLAILILARLNRPIDQEVVLAEVKEITVICPLCRRRQKLATGGAACVGCRLRIVVRLEEPHCAKCGYLLYGIASQRCPECGEPIDASATGASDAGGPEERALSPAAPPL